MVWLSESGIEVLKANFSNSFKSISIFFPLVSVFLAFFFHGLLAAVKYCLHNYVEYDFMSYNYMWCISVSETVPFENSINTDCIGVGAYLLFLPF